MPTGVYKHKFLNHSGNFKKGMVPWNKGKRKYTDEERKAIHNARAKKYRMQHPERIKAYRLKRREQACKSNRENYLLVGRSRKIKKNYGISVEEYDLLLERQNHRCAICGKESTDGNRTFCVDHDHKTKKVRGLLCRNCNSGIGLLQDSENIILQALAYLRR